MNVSSRWCVTAVFAFGALACSDPVPPPAQGAFIASVKPASPQPEGKSCPSPAFTYDVPIVRDAMPTPTNPAPAAEVLDADNYTHKIINGEKGATVSCAVKSGGGGFTFSGEILLGGKGLKISGGTLGANMMGTATITVNNSEKLSPPQLISPTGACTVNAAKANGNNFQVRGGSMWAAFTCTSVELMPANSCASDGFFVLENCDQ